MVQVAVAVAPGLPNYVAKAIVIWDTCEILINEVGRCLSGRQIHCLSGPLSLDPQQQQHSVEGGNDGPRETKPQPNER